MSKTSTTKKKSKENAEKNVFVILIFHNGVKVIFYVYLKINLAYSFLYWTDGKTWAKYIHITDEIQIE